MPTTSEPPAPTDEALEVTAGPAAGTRVGIRGDELVIGRAEAGVGALGGDGELSREHARLRRLADGRWLVEDLGSTNGTWVNGARIPAPTVVSEGDELGVGASVLRVLAARPAPAPGAAAPKEKRPGLRVVAGWAPGAYIPVGAGTLTLGTEGPAASVFEGDPAIAAEHAKVSPAGREGLLVEDLGTSGGTLVGGIPIPAPTLVRVGERFQIGGSTVEVIGAADPARMPAVEHGLARGGVRALPEGLFARIAMRAPVSRQEVVTTAAIALGWSLGLVLLTRELAFGALDVAEDLNALEIGSILITTIAPIAGNSIGFYKAFRRPDDTSMRRYLAPTVGIPLVFVVLNLVRINHSGAVEIAVTVLVTLLPITLCAVLMLRLRDRVARRRVAAVRGG